MRCAARRPGTPRSRRGLRVSRAENSGKGKGTKNGLVDRREGQLRSREPEEATVKPDLVIRGGTIVDGTGAPPFEGDVAISGDRITAVGKGATAGREELDARGLIVTPGFIDVHTHLDAQITWDPLGAPSNQHGVTSVVVGNCGVGFAPCKAKDRDYLMFLMEGVEDIPQAAMRAGLRWNWETVP